MKIFKNFIFLLLLLVLASSITYANASELLEDTEEVFTEEFDEFFEEEPVIDEELLEKISLFLSGFNDLIPNDSLMENEDYRVTYEAYNYELMHIAEEYILGGYELEYATELINSFISERNIVLSNIEQQILEEEYNTQQEEMMDRVDGFVDIMTVYDTNGNVIKDYTNIDFSDFPNKRTITVQGVLLSGTTTASDFYIKVYVMARNLFYEPEPVILDKSNNYTVQIDVPNDQYLICFSDPNTEDIYSIPENGKVIDVRMNPKIEFQIFGSIKVDSNAGEIVMIEGNEYVEVEDEVEDTINTKLIVLIVAAIIAVVVIILGIIYIFKIKRENEI